MSDKKEVSHFTVLHSEMGPLGETYWTYESMYYAPLAEQWWDTHLHEDVGMVKKYGKTFFGWTPTSQKLTSKLVRQNKTKQNNGTNMSSKCCNFWYLLPFLFLEHHETPMLMLSSHQCAQWGSTLKRWSIFDLFQPVKRSLKMQWMSPHLYISMPSAGVLKTETPKSP